MDGVPLKMPEAVSQESTEDVRVTIPDFLSILQSTEYEFCLEKLVLTGLQSGIVSQHRPPHHPSAAPGLLPSCPPYWMMFGSPLGSEPSRQQYPLSLERTTRPTIPDSGDEGARMARNAKDTSPQMTVDAKATPSRQRASDLLNPNSTCLGEKRKNLQQCSTPCDHDQKYLDDNPHADNQDQSPSSQKTLNTMTPNKQVSNATDTVRNKGRRLPNITNPKTMASLRRDSSTELLSVLSPEERELLGTITAQGYPFDTAILALQRTGQHNPEQILSYLVACDHLCQLGYDKAQVEEALEMFQNCETKAEEFLHLLSQFDEMGFQQNAIKEVLLVHENHRERALEELMMRVA